MSQPATDSTSAALSVVVGASALRVNWRTRSEPSAVRSASSESNTRRRSSNGASYGYSSTCSTWEPSQGNWTRRTLICTRSCSTSGPIDDSDSVAISSSDMSYKPLQSSASASRSSAGAAACAPATAAQTIPSRIRTARGV
jgi:hypothetical protein